MKQQLPAAVTSYLADIGAKGGEVGGKATTPAKRRASRQNGKLGGRPKGSKNKPKV
jgi:hypothetical protein